MMSPKPLPGAPLAAILLAVLIAMLPVTGCSPRSRTPRAFPYLGTSSFPRVHRAAGRTATTEPLPGGAEIPSGLFSLAAGDALGRSTVLFEGFVSERRNPRP